MITDNNKKDEIGYSILKKYFENTGSKEETNLVKNWLINSENNYKSESSLKLLWKEITRDIKDSEEDLDVLLDKIHHTINLNREKEQIRESVTEPKPRISYAHIFRNVARVASILLLPLLGYIGWEVFEQKMWVNRQTEIVYNEIVCPSIG